MEFQAKQKQVDAPDKEVTLNEALDVFDRDRDINKDLIADILVDLKWKKR